MFSDIAYWINAICTYAFHGTASKETLPSTIPEKYGSHNNSLEIRETVTRCLARCDIPYHVTRLDHDFHSACCREARRKGYPMGSPTRSPSLAPFIPGGVVMATTAYAHLPNESTRIFIALYTAFLIYLDDVFQKDVDRVSVFNDRFIQGQPQEDPVLDSFAALLHEIPNHYGRVVSNIMLTSTLNLVNALLLEHETQTMPLSPDAHGFPTFSRVMSGASEAYALFAFPPEIPLQSYIQALPELMMFINNGNDILSFYKEDLAGESVNRVSNLASCHKLSKMTVLHGLAEDVVACHSQVSAILLPSRDAHTAFIKFGYGYVGFHTSLPRYRLREMFNS